ncbi:MAG TPA: hypothetical protein VF092_00285 [Longimicrobium sp.]
MKKKLRIEELGVDSFVVAGAGGERGTVRAHGQSEPYVCASGVWTCLESCEDTCGLTCWASCWATCDSCVDTCNCA